MVGTDIDLASDRCAHIRRPLGVDSTSDTRSLAAGGGRAARCVRRRMDSQTLWTTIAAVAAGVLAAWHYTRTPSVAVEAPAVLPLPAAVFE